MKDKMLNASYNPFVGCATHSTFTVVCEGNLNAYLAYTLTSGDQPMEKSGPYNDLLYPADGQVSVLSFPDVLFQITDSEGMQSLVVLGEKSEAGTRSRVHATVDTCSNCVPTRPSVKYTFRLLPRHPVELECVRIPNGLDHADLYL